jgi:prepilin-type N-terminal cleavage/methylation domain-containing protein
MKKNKPGFTLIELLIVIVIIIILVGVGVPLSAGYITERNVYNAATQVQQDLLLVQNLAITHSAGKDSKRFEIYFYPTKNTYYVEAEVNAMFTPPSGISGKVIVRKFSSALKIEGISDGWCIAFDNQGIPYPVTSASITVSIGNGNKKLKVVVSPIGRVIIEWEKK